MSDTDTSEISKPVRQPETPQQREAKLLTKTQEALVAKAAGEPTTDVSGIRDSMRKNLIRPGMSRAEVADIEKQISEAIRQKSTSVKPPAGEKVQ